MLLLSNSWFQVIDLLVPIGMEWIGVYRRADVCFLGFVISVYASVPNVDSSVAQDALVKEAYCGSISRPVFPLTEEFASLSSNSSVGLTGKANVIAVRFCLVPRCYRFYTVDFAGSFVLTRCSVCERVCRMCARLLDRTISVMVLCCPRLACQFGIVTVQR